jgi:hypothetical protein
MKVHRGAILDEALDELGWREALATDPRGAVSILFELQGSANAVSSALDDVVVSCIGVEAGSPQGVVLPCLGRTDPPGKIVGRTLTVRGLATAGLRSRDIALVAATSEKCVTVAAVERKALAVRPLGGLNPTLGLLEVTGSLELAAIDRRDLSDDWARAVGLGQLAVAHELVGAQRAMLGLARDHAIERVQFGRPISSFQAVRHRLADSLVAIESADAAISAAWESRSALEASMAKAIAGNAAWTVARHSQQVLAGIGFTAEHAFHHFFRRALVLDQVFGSARALTAELGEDLLRDRRLPAMLPL